MLGKKKVDRDEGTQEGQLTPATQKVTKERWQAFLNERGTLEAELLDEMNTSRRNAWTVAKGAFVGMLIGLGIAGFVIYRYSQPIPAQMLTRNPETGMYEPTTLKESSVSYGEATDSGFVARYIINRMSYNYYSQQTFYDTTVLMSSRKVAAPYKEKWGGQDGLDKRWGDSRFVKVEVNSVILDGDGRATVRYTTQTHIRGQRQAEPKQHWIATLSYEYPNRVMDVEERYLNPLGFTVTSFDKHRENAGTR